jgi:hypothetical protein
MDAVAAGLAPSTSARLGNVRSKIVFGSGHKITGIRHAWTFDEFSPSQRRRLGRWRSARANFCSNSATGTDAGRGLGRTYAQVALICRLSSFNKTFLIPQVAE